MRTVSISDLNRPLVLLVHLAILVGVGSAALAQGMPMQLVGSSPMRSTVAQSASSLAYASDEREQFVQSTSQIDERYKRAYIDYPSKEGTGTVIIDTANRYLYLVTGRNRAVRYGVGVGREGFTWAGVERISNKTEWPDWRPTPAMLKRQPYLPRFMAGGEGNPLGARALYLGSSSYRIHGTNDPSTIGKFVSSGCIRLTNEDVEDLFNRVHVGAKVIVLNKRSPMLVDARASAFASR